MKFDDLPKGSPLRAIVEEKAIAMIADFAILTYMAGERGLAVSTAAQLLKMKYPSLNATGAVESLTLCAMGANFVSLRNERYYFKEWPEDVRERMVVEVSKPEITEMTKGARAIIELIEGIGSYYSAR